MVRVLVVDDDLYIRELIALYMRNEGFSVYEAEDGQEALDILSKHKVNIAIIDIMMPKIDGYELCQDIRSYYDIPILMVTAKGETTSKIKGFQSGTDDYIVKPFEPVELVMRVKALLRRYQIQSSQRLVLGEVTLDSRTKELIINNQATLLPLKEFDLLFLLGSYPNQILTRQSLIEDVWGIDYEGDERTLDVHIKRLRDKLKQVENTIKIITVRGVGYRLEVKPS